MNKFEYEVTTHPAHEFTDLAYFCSERGECAYGKLPSEQLTRLQSLLNEAGSRGLELVQLFFGEGGVVAIWKRPV